MAVTNYHTINGEILSEQTGGVRTEYMHDALGSVTGTTDGSGNVQNRYWWAPYGTQIARTGSAADPDFQWVGTLGYRATGRMHAGCYVRGRHYGAEQHSWVSTDALWPLMSAYAYAKARAAMLADASGPAPTLNVTSTEQILSPRPSTCWSAESSDFYSGDMQYRLGPGNRWK